MENAISRSVKIRLPGKRDVFTLVLYFTVKMEKRVLSGSAKRKQKKEKDTKDTALVGYNKSCPSQHFLTKNKNKVKKFFQGSH